MLNNSLGQNKYANLNNSIPFLPISPQKNELIDVNNLSPPPIIYFGGITSENSLETKSEIDLNDIYIEEENESSDECFNPLISSYLNNKLYIQSNPEINCEVFYL